MTSLKKRQFGRVVIKDKRDKKHKLVRRKTSRTSRYWSDGHWFGDQGSNPYCVGFAWSHWLNCSPYRQWLKPAGIYAMAQHFDEWTGEDYEGTSVRGGAKVLSSLGFIKKYQWTWDVDTLAATILEVGPVVVGTSWYANMSQPKDGFLKPTGALQGGHAYLLTGVNTKKRIFRVKNSWGKSWGLKGRAWISFEDMAQLLADDGECCLGIEMQAKV